MFIIRSIITRFLPVVCALLLLVAPSASAMILLASTSDLLRVVTGSAITTDVHVSYVDLNGSTVTPGRTNTLITTATTTTETLNTGLGAYDLPAASNATSAATTNNVAVIEGYVTPSANGTVVIRFASEILSSAITAKAGSLLEGTGG